MTASDSKKKKNVIGIVLNTIVSASRSYWTAEKKKNTVAKLATVPKLTEHCCTEDVLQILY